MDPLGAKPPTCDVSELQPWGDGDPEGSPPFPEGSLPKAHKTSPFPVREDLNKKVAIW